MSNNSSGNVTKVFISYAHESAELADAVLDLANYLRSKGIDAEIDQYEEAPPEGWPKWMMRQVQQAEFVLVVCSKLYSERANDFSTGETGLGVKWETNLILQQLYGMSTNNTKFIPVFFGSGAQKWIPLPLQPYTHYDVNDDARRLALLARLAKTYRTKRPELGERPVEELDAPPLDAKERKSLFVTSIIDLDLWNKAGWKAMAYLSDPSLKQPPLVGFVFEDNEVGSEIFKGLRYRFGPVDSVEEIRLSFISGISVARPQDYKVHFGTDWSSFFGKLEQAGMNPNESLVMSLGRIHEMNPPAGSRTLEVFKHAYAYFGRYGVTNFRMEAGKLRPDFESVIMKKRVHFRAMSDVKTRHDPDSVVLNP
jgi:hypothetical protein